jgi:hypothetical protein
LGVIALVLKTQLACIATTLCASTLAWLLLKEENQIAWFHQRATQQFVAGERGIAPFSSCFVRRGLNADRPRHLNSIVGRRSLSF